jgi:hypothetical protein
MHTLSLAGDRSEQLFESQAIGGSFSPDGSWVAYQSFESGRAEIWVRPFPSGPGKRQISRDGGTAAFWGRSGELFFLSGDKMMAVDITTSPTVTVGTPRVLFERDYGQPIAYNTTPDGRRFLMLKPGEQTDAVQQLHVALNWAEELKHRTPAK